MFQGYHDTKRVTALEKKQKQSLFGILQNVLWKSSQHSRKNNYDEILFPKAYG